MTRAGNGSLTITDICGTSGSTGEDGWDTYVIETHCVAWKITAKKLDGWWRIRTVTSEPA